MFIDVLVEQWRKENYNTNSSDHTISFLYYLLSITEAYNNDKTKFLSQFFIIFMINDKQHDKCTILTSIHFYSQAQTLHLNLIHILTLSLTLNH